MTQLRRKKGDLIAWIILCVSSIIMFFPFFWMIVTSLKPDNEVFLLRLPSKIVLDNYVKPFVELPFGRFFINTFYIALICTIGEIFLCSLSGYAFARLRFPGRDVLFLVFLATMMIPIQVRLIPLYRIMQFLGWIDTHYALIFPFLTFYTAWGTFLARTFVTTIPRDLDDAAKIDGCSIWGIYFHVILPQMKPVLITIGIFVFVHIYSEFLWPMLVINSVELKTVSLGLSMMQSRVYAETPWNRLMAAAAVSLMPMVFIFLIGQRYYVQGVVTTGLKG